MGKAERDMRRIVAQLASVRAQLAGIDNKALTHIDEAKQAHAARTALARRQSALEQRFAAHESRRAEAA